MPPKGAETLVMTSVSNTGSCEGGGVVTVVVATGLLVAALVGLTEGGSILSLFMPGNSLTNPKQ